MTQKPGKDGKTASRSAPGGFPPPPPIAAPTSESASRGRLLVRICALFTAGIGLIAMVGWLIDQPVLASLGSGRIPVAPSTAALFVLYALAVYLRASLPLNRLTYWTGLALNVAGSLVALGLFILSIQGIQPDVEHLGLTIVNKPGETPVGHMSPVTAVCFLLSSLSYLLSLPPSRGRGWAGNLAWWLAGCVIATGSLLVLAYLYGTPMFYGSVFIPPAALTSMAFMALGAALLALAAPRAWQARPHVESTARASYTFLLVFALLATGIVFAGFLYFRNYEIRHRTELERQLSAIADLKVDGIVNWRKERLGDAALFYRNVNYSIRVKQYFSEPKDAETTKKLLAWMLRVHEGYQYDRIFLLDAHGRERLSIPEARRPISRTELLCAAEVLRTKKVCFLDLYRNEFDQHVYLAILIPVIDEQANDRPLGTLVLRIDPEQYFYPFLQRWPASSESAETLLVRREGNEVLFLHELRFQKNTALNLRISLDRQELPAVQAILGRQGIMDGIDYRGVRVIADVRAVPGSPWFLVSKMDTAEVYGALREKLWTIVILVLALLAGAGAAMYTVWRRQLTQFYQARYEATAALLESQERLRLLIEGVKDYAIIMLDSTGKVLSWNSGAERIKGYREEEILGRNFACFYPEEEIEQGKPRQDLQESAAGGRFEAEGWRLRKDGSRFWADVVITALSDEAGGLRGFAKVTRDVTERKQAEDHLKETLADLERSNQELEQFAYVASHDLQEPLRMVSSYTQLLAERYRGQLDDKAQKYINYAVDGALRMQVLINDLLAYSRIGTRGNPLEPTDTGIVLAEAISNLKMQIDEVKAGITNDDLPEVRADGPQLVLVFQNLLGNALKFRGEEAPRVHISAKDAGREWLFSVRDNGIGIEPDYADKVFVIFQRLHTREEYPGSGIGLAICKKIVERHGGRIWFESEPGRGSTFYFTVPK